MVVDMRYFSTTLIKNSIEFVKRHEVLCLFCLVYLIYCINGRTIGSGDTIPASLLPFSILENHNLYLDQFSYYFESTFNQVHWVQEIDGHYLSVYPIVTPVLITPLYVLLFLFMKISHIPTDMFHPGFVQIVAIMEKLSASLIASLSVIFVFLSLKDLINKKTAFIVAIIFAFATNTWTISSQGLWQHGFVELFLALSIYLVVLNEKHNSDKIIICLGIISGLFIFNRLSDSILLIPTIYHILTMKDRRIIYYLCAMSLTSTPFLFYNIHYFSSIFGGYAGTAAAFNFNPEMITRFIGLLVSPSRGLFIFTPIMLFSIAGYFKISNLSSKRLKNFLLISGGSILAQIIVYSAFSVWWAGWSYGPRFLTGMLPALTMFLGLYVKDISFNIKTRKNLLVICIISILLIWSVFAQLVGVFCYPNGNWDGDPNVDLHPDRLWDWKDTQITRSFNAGIIPPRNLIKDLLVLANPPQDIVAGGTLGKGWYGIEIWDGTSTRWMENNALIYLLSPENHTSNLSMRITSFYHPRTLEIYLGGELAARANVSSAGFQDMMASIHLMKGTNTMRFHIREGCERPFDKPELNNHDSRCLSVGVQNLTVV